MVFRPYSNRATFMSLNFYNCFYNINEKICIAVQLKKFLQRSAKIKKLCALGSAVGSHFLGTGAGCTGVLHGGAPVLATQVYSQNGEHSGPSQSSGHVFFSFGMATLSGGGNVFLFFEIFWITG